MIPFNRPPYTGGEEIHVLSAMKSGKMCGDGAFGLRCQDWFERHLGCGRALLTPSCTQALEMAAILADLQPGDEVIMPSYTFVSTANAFVLRGAKIVFVDIRPDTLNIDETLIEGAITSRTKVIVPVHYAGVACEMDAIMAIAGRHNLLVVEDAAQAMMSTYKNSLVGTHGHLAAFSFHETKNYTSGGEGGLLIINDPKFSERAEIIREKGTNRSQFFRGAVDKYSWKDLGSSYLPSELQAAYLWGQLENVDEILADRRKLWAFYENGLNDLVTDGRLEIPVIPPGCAHNGHMFYVKLRDIEERTRFISHLSGLGVMAVFHYIPLHSASAGHKFGRFHGADRVTTIESERVVRLPLWFGMSEAIRNEILVAVRSFFT